VIGQVAFGQCSTVLAALVALVFTTAALLKLGDRRDAIGTFAQMGFVKDPDSRWALLLFAGVVGLELLVSVALVVVPPIGAALGLGMLVIFTAVLARTARTRPTVRCACFGSVSQRPIGLSTFVRNALLMLALVPAVGWLFAGASLRPTWGLGSVFFGAGAALASFVVVQLASLTQDSGYLTGPNSASLRDPSVGPAPTGKPDWGPGVRSAASFDSPAGSTGPGVPTSSSGKAGLKAAS
jgi:hypothetical protein